MKKGGKEKRKKEKIEPSDENLGPNNSGNNSPKPTESSKALEQVQLKPQEKS